MMDLSTHKKVVDRLLSYPPGNLPDALWIEKSDYIGLVAEFYQFCSLEEMLDPPPNTFMGVPLKVISEVI